ncbi:MAG: phosphodiesterase [Clostridia bacterium]|nr:phosphodiesterase [Clostridia bacterium]
MKYLIASDIHGSALYCRALLDAFAREGADRLVLLGDILYHGPRNDLPEGYAPKEVISLLSPCKDKILAVRGNCDTEVDQMVLPFPVLADYAVIDAGGRLLYLSHGHKYGEENPPPLAKGDILLCGHTHVPRIAEHEGFTYLNPGSVSIPKEGSAHGYILFDGESFLFKDLCGGIYDSYELGGNERTPL